MAPITTVSFTHDRRRYEVQLNVDYRAIMMGDKLVLEVTAKVTDADGTSAEQGVTLEFDLGEGRGRILNGGELWHEFALADVLVKIDDSDDETVPAMDGYGDAPEDQPDTVADFVSEHCDPFILKLIDAVPAFDPIFGCALKAGISSTLGQTIACNEIVGSDGPVRQRAWRIIRCLGGHIGGIFSHTLWRAVRCMGSLGLL